MEKLTPYDPYDKIKLGEEYCFSSGMTTRKVLANRETKMHNIITEGFFEETARAISLGVISSSVMDIDEEKYLEYVAMAQKIITSRDLSNDARVRARNRRIQ